METVAFSLGGISERLTSYLGGGGGGGGGT